MNYENPNCSLLLILSLSVFAFAQEYHEDTAPPRDETPEEELERLRRENREQSVELQNRRTADQNRQNRDRQEQNREAIDAVVDAVNKVAGAVNKAATVAVKVIYGRCSGYCGRLGYQPTEHRQTCKAGHVWWSCAPGDHRWQHAHCCPPGKVWSNSFGCVEPGYSPPPPPWYGSSGSSSGDCTGEGCD